MATEQTLRLYVRQKPLRFSVLAAMLCLGSKYNFEHLRGKALFRLQAEFPTIKKWDDLPSGYTYITECSLLSDIINLALDWGSFSILPGAYYACIMIEDVVRPSLFIPMESYSKLPLTDWFRKLFWTGGQETMGQRLFSAWSATGLYYWKAEDFRTAREWRFDHTGPFDCSDQIECEKARQSLALSAFKPLFKLAPSCCLEPWGEVEKVLSKPCCNYAKVKHAEDRSKMWKMMPEMFGFPPWDELKKLDRIWLFVSSIIHTEIQLTKSWAHNKDKTWSCAFSHNVSRRDKHTKLPITRFIALR